MDTIILSGGIGKLYAFTALINKYRLTVKTDFNLLSGFPSLFKGIHGIRRASLFNVPFGYTDYFDGNTIHWLDPYREPNFFSGKQHLITGYARQLGLKYLPKTDYSLYPTLPVEATEGFDALRTAGDGYVVMQFWGGNPDPKNLNRDLGAKNYPHHLIVKFVELFAQIYPKIKLVNFGHKSEIPRDVAEAYQKYEVIVPELPAHYGPALLKHARSFVAIDSCLNHFSNAKNAARGVVLWGSTNPVNLSYPCNINLTGECPTGCLHCNRPYPTMPTSDFDGDGQVWQCPDKTCIHIKPEEIMNALKELVA